MQKNFQRGEDEDDDFEEEEATQQPGALGRILVRLTFRASKDELQVL